MNTGHPEAPEPDDVFAVLAHRSRHPVVRDHTVCWTGAELLARSAGAAALLDAEQVPAGRPVPVLLNTTPTTVAIALGALGSRRPAAPLGPRSPIEELAAAVVALEASVLLAEPGTAKVAAEVATAAGARCIVVDDVPAATAAGPASPGDDEVGVVFHTSGTTGRPKPVPARIGPLRHRVAVYRELLDLRAGDRYWTASPLHHVAGLGMVLTALAAGATVLAVPGFSVDRWTRLAELGPTHCLLVPTMIDQLLASRELAATRPRVLQYGAAPITPDLLADATAALPDTDFVQMFGQTEGNPICCLTAADHRLARTRPELLATVGRPVPGLQLAVDRQDADGVGDILARAPHLFGPGPDGWLTTGDLGRQDGDGYIRLTGRRGDKIVRGGENVYPSEVEAVLRAHPAVADAAVVGVADRRWGQTVHAAVVPRVGARAGEEELRRYARSRLAGFKVPTSWAFPAALPRNAAGKVLRSRLVPDPSTDRPGSARPASARPANNPACSDATPDPQEPTP